MPSPEKDLIIVTGFSGSEIGGVKGLDCARNLFSDLTDAIKFESKRIILGCPREHAREHPLDRIDFIRHAMGQAVRDRLVIGLSYGGLLALGAECERKRCGEKLDNLMLVDAPLNPDVEVNPPSDGRFNAFSTQYEHRVGLARRYRAVLREIPESELGKIVTIGSKNDDIVSSDAKHLLGVNHYELPENISGHGLSPEKIQAIIQFLVAQM